MGWSLCGGCVEQIAITIAMLTKDPCYYVTLFKIKDHTNWRMHVAKTKNEFERVAAPSMTVTNKKTYQINRVTGTVEEL